MYYTDGGGAVGGDFEKYTTKIGFLKNNNEVPQNEEKDFRDNPPVFAYNNSTQSDEQGGFMA